MLLDIRWRVPYGPPRMIVGAGITDRPPDWPIGLLRVTHYLAITTGGQELLSLVWQLAICAFGVLECRGRLATNDLT